MEHLVELYLKALKVSGAVVKRVLAATSEVAMLINKHQENLCFVSDDYLGYIREKSISWDISSKVKGRDIITRSYLTI